MIIFLGGIHGVGKTHFGENIISGLNITYARASQLIEKEIGNATWETDKKTNQINANQFALINAVKKINYQDINLLLDGHFCIKETGGRIKRIPIDIFKSLNIDGILLLEADVTTIQERLLNRDKIHFNIDELISLQIEEKEHALNVSNSLSIPIRFLKNPTHALFTTSLELLFKQIEDIQNPLN